MDMSKVDGLKDCKSYSLKWGRGYDLAKRINNFARQNTDSES